MAPDEEAHKVQQDELQHHFSREDAYFHDLEKSRTQAAHERAQMRRVICRKPERPADGCLLEQVSFHGVSVDRCGTCGGIWVDQHELEEIFRNLEKDHHEPKKPMGFLQTLVEGLRPA